MKIANYEMFRWIALAASIVLVVAFVGAIVAQQTSPEPPREQAAVEKTGVEQNNENTKVALWDRWFPDSISLYTLWLVVFTAVLAFGGIYQFRFLIRSEQIAASNALAAKESADAARRSAETAERSLVAANRPWIKVDIHVAGPIFYNINGANFTFRYSLKNIGHSPATNVWVTPHVELNYPDRAQPFNAATKMRKVIAGLKTSPPSPFGFAIFPDDTVSQDVSVSVSQEEIKRATAMLPAIYPTVIGAVDYRSGFDDTPHQTGFCFEVRRRDVQRPSTTARNRSPAAIWIDEGDVPASELQLFRSIVDGGYAD